jgi:hypothetical protein
MPVVMLTAGEHSDAPGNFFYRWGIWMGAAGITFYPWRTSKSAPGGKISKNSKKFKKNQKNSKIF